MTNDNSLTRAINVIYCVKLKFRFENRLIRILRVLFPPILPQNNDVALYKTFYPSFCEYSQGFCFNQHRPFVNFNQCASAARCDVSLSPRLLLCCFRVTAHCRKFFNSHLSAENETACQTKNIVPTVWQRANNSPDFLISRFLSLPLLKTGGRNRIETRLFVFIDTARRKRPTTIPTSESLFFATIFANKICLHTCTLSFDDRSISFDLFDIFEISEFVQSLSFPIHLFTSRFRNAHIGSFPYRGNNQFSSKSL